MSWIPRARRKLSSTSQFAQNRHRTALLFLSSHRHQHGMDDPLLLSQRPSYLPHLLRIANALSMSETLNHAAFVAKTSVIPLQDPKTTVFSDTQCPRRKPHPIRAQPVRASAVPQILTSEPSSPQISASQLAESLVQAGSMNSKDAPLLGMLSDSRAALFAKVLTNRTRRLTFVLDGVFGAHNLAAIARSCDAWGIQDLHFITQPEEYLPKQHKGRPDKALKNVSILDRFKQDQSVQNVSKNCHKWLTIQEHPTPQPCLAALRAAGYKIIVSSLADDARSIHDVDLTDKCAFVFGNEKHGVTKEVQAQADGFFTIPMMGFVESMNVSVAVATAASLTTTRCRSTIPASDYFLSHVEMRDLAHLWLEDRFSVKQAPKKIQTRRDVTKLGHQCEKRIINDGMFAHVEDSSVSGEDYWNLALRPTGDGGRRVITDVFRRKVGILGEIGFEKRCLAINFCIGASHALTCEAALSSEGTSTISRQRLRLYFERLCEEVSATYRPYFDQYGVPLLPAHVADSSQIFSTLERNAPRISRALCEDIASDVFGIGVNDIYDVISVAGITDIAQCVSETVRCNTSASEQLKQIAAMEPDLLEQLKMYMDEGELDHEERPTSAATEPASATLSRQDKDILHVFLRLSNAAAMCSEVYQTLWHRHSHNDVSRIHSPRFGLLESLLSDMYTEMTMRKCSHELALFRVLFEWHRILQSFQYHIEHQEK